MTVEMTVGDRIKKRRKQLKMTADALADKLGKNRATIYRYESDDIDNMPLSVLEPLAKALGVSPGYLMGWEDENENDSFLSSYPYFPTSISAGLPINVDPLLGSDAQFIELPNSLMGKWANQSGLYLTRVNGESMNRVIPHDSMIAVKFSELSELNNGDVIVYSDNGSYSVKRYYDDKENQRIIFRPDSTIESFTDHVVTYRDADNIKIHGKVVLYVVEFN